jgi:transcriptional regulator of acetoin/glycerol metabolism
MLVDAERAEELTLSHLRGDALASEGGAARPLTTATVSNAVQLAGSVTAAARLLGISRSTVHRHLGRGERSL